MYKTDTYLCEMTYPLDEVQRDIITYLYLPLIGVQALTRITSTINVSVAGLEDALKMLEGIGLLRSFYKQGRFLFVIQSPLSLKAFFSNQVLVTLLMHTIGEEDFHLTRNHFRVVKEDKEGYEEKTSSFGSIYSVDLSQSRPLDTQGVRCITMMNCISS